MVRAGRAGAVTAMEAAARAEEAVASTREVGLATAVVARVKAAGEMVVVVVAKAVEAIVPKQMHVVARQ